MTEFGSEVFDLDQGCSYRLPLSDFYNGTAGNVPPAEEWLRRHPCNGESLNWRLTAPEPDGPLGRAGHVIVTYAT